MREHRIGLDILPNEPGPARDQAERNLYLREIDRQSHFALIGLHRALSGASPESPADPLPWYHLQAALAAAVVLSRLLKGDDILAKGDPTARKRGGVRGRMLRTLLQVDDDSPLLDHTLRNHFEHFDQRLDDLIRDKVINVVDLCVSAPGKLILKGEDGQPVTVAMLRELAPEAGFVTFREDTLDIFAIRSELQRIRALAQDLLHEPLPESKRAVRVAAQLVSYFRIDDQGTIIDYPYQEDPMLAPQLEEPGSPEHRPRRQAARLFRRR